MRSKQIFCAGLAVADVLLKPVSRSIFREAGDIEAPELRPGGDALNQAVVLHRLGIRSTLSAAVGRDLWGDQLLAALRREGLDTEQIQRMPDHGTTTCFILVEDNGERHFLCHKDATAAYTLEADALPDDVDILSIGSLWALESMDLQRIRALCGEARRRGILTVADFADDTLHMGIPYAHSVIPEFDYLVPSYDEATLITGQREPEAIVAALEKLGARNIIVKLGAEGCIARLDGKMYRQPSVATRVVDTTGAGDNFTAAFLACLCRELSPERCLLLASRAAARGIAAYGATGARYTFEDLLDDLP